MKSRFTKILTFLTVTLVFFKLQAKVVYADYSPKGQRELSLAMITFYNLLCSIVPLSSFMLHVVTSYLMIKKKELDKGLNIACIVITALNWCISVLILLMYFNIAYYYHYSQLEVPADQKFNFILDVVLPGIALIYPFIPQILLRIIARKNKYL